MRAAAYWASISRAWKQPRTEYRRTVMQSGPPGGYRRAVLFEHRARRCQPNQRIISLTIVPAPALAITLPLASNMYMPPVIMLLSG